jgi:probable HAF family extracellular repeat protein
LLSRTDSTSASDAHRSGKEYIMRLRAAFLSAALASCGLFAVSAPPAQAAAIHVYRTVDLGILGSAHAINDRGQIVGGGILSPGASHPFLRDHGRTIDLGVLGLGAHEYGTATDINDRGQVVGSSIATVDQEGESVQHAFLWQHGRMTDLGTLGGSFSHATSINDHGQVVGYSDTGTTAGLHGFLWQRGRMIDLGMRIAHDINNRGQVVGTSTFGTSANHACLWQNGRLVNLDTGTVAWPTAIAINDHGWITGHNESLIPAHAFLWRSGVITDLGNLGADNTGVMDVNNRGQILGYSSLPRPGAIHAFIWERGQMKDLTAFGVPEYPNIASFNNRAQIVGYEYREVGYSAVVYR